MLKLDMHDEKTKKKAMKTVSGFSGIIIIFFISMIILTYKSRLLLNIYEFI
jgi:hypothetical protein